MLIKLLGLGFVLLLILIRHAVSLSTHVLKFRHISVNILIVKTFTSKQRVALLMSLQGKVQTKLVVKSQLGIIPNRNKLNLTVV